MHINSKRWKGVDEHIDKTSAGTEACDEDMGGSLHYSNFYVLNSCMGNEVQWSKFPTLPSHPPIQANQH